MHASTLALNDEATLMVRDGPVAERLERQFATDLRNATDVDAPVLAQRPWIQHAAECGSNLITRLL